MLLLVTLLAGSLTACTIVKDAPKSGSTAVPRTTTVPGETVEPSVTGLRATTEVPAALPSGESVNLRFTLTNNSDTRLHILKWYTPLEGLAGETLYIERDGQVIPYQGILASRDTPPSHAYLLLDAGESVSAEVDLATAYDFSEAGVYTIKFLSPKISHIARSEAEMAKTVDDLGPVQIAYTVLKVGDWIKITAEGVSELKSVLGRLAPGEHVSWNRARHLEPRSRESGPKLRLPPGRVVREVRAYCVELDLDLNASR